MNKSKPSPILAGFIFAVAVWKIDHSAEWWPGLIPAIFIGAGILIVGLLIVFGQDFIRSKDNWREAARIRF
jgi:hypothetical protein